MHKPSIYGLGKAQAGLEQQRPARNGTVLAEAAGAGEFRNIDQFTNLTAFQFLIWAAHHLYPKAPLFNVPFLFTIAGDVDAACFQQAFKVLVDVTDAMRIVVTETSGFIRQQILADVPSSLEYLDFSHYRDPDISLRDWAGERSQVLFDLERCVFDTALIKLSDGRYAWYLNMHHIAADAWSFSVLLRRMKEIYEHSVQGRPHKLAPYPQFRDYLPYEQTYRRSAQYLDDHAYWSHKLSKVESIQFPGRKVRRSTTEIHRVICDLGPERTKRLDAIANEPDFAGKSFHVSAFNILASLFAASLHGISGDRRFLVGTPFLNRRTRDHRGTVGLLMQVAPLHLHVPEDATFVSLIRQLQEESHATLQHSQYPIRNYEGSAYDFEFNYHNRRAYPRFDGAPVQERWLDPEHDTLSLSVQVLNPELTGGTFSLTFDFHRDVFSEEQSRRAVGQFLQVVDGFLADPTMRISQIDWLSVADARMQHVPWRRGALEGQLAHWRRQLSGAPATELPTDRPRPPVQSHMWAVQEQQLSTELTAGLRTQSRQAGGALFMVLLAGLKLLLARLTGQEDLVVGTVTAGSDRREPEGSIGPGVNWLALRTDISGNPTFWELLGRVREVCLGAYAHQDLPFEKFVEELQPERNMCCPPLFQVMFNMLQLEQSTEGLDGLNVEHFSLEEVRSRFDLTVYLREKDHRVTCSFVYSSDLYDPARMEELAAQYQYLLEQIVVDPNRPIGSYSLVTPGALRLLPSPTAVLDESRQESVTSLFADWVQRTPERPAVSQGRQSWTYGELAERAQGLARALLAKGVEKGEVVAISGRPSFGLTAGLMGTLWSRAVFLLLDPHLPRERQALMLREAKAGILLRVGSDAYPEGRAGLPVLEVDEESGRPVGISQDIDLAGILLPELTPEDPAYIFFTSGTTGVPRGILGWHKGLSHFVQWQRETFDIGPGDRLSQLTSLSFDAVMREIILSFTSGATLCLPGKDTLLGSEELWRWLEREQITVLHTVPSLAQHWLSQVPGGVSLESLRWVFFAGESLTDTLVRRWREAFPAVGELVNFYGPTETTLIKTFYQVPQEVLPGVQPVGRPMPGTQALVLTADNQLCGIGEPGEIVLRTPFRTLGYINAPEGNRRRFVQNPFRHHVVQAAPGEQDLLYYTGDRGRYRPDGLLEILGRLDDQVKIRGVRIETGEVTAILGQHPAVAECAIIPREDEQGHAYLVAYVVASAKRQATVSQMRAFLGRRLPAVMVPQTFVLLDRLPLLPNGKVDRRALPGTQAVQLEMERAYVAPRTEVEERLAAIWTEVLRLDHRVGVHDDFFDLGGHSLLATQVIARVRSALKVELPLRSLFQRPTVAGLADLLGKVPWATLGSPTPGGELPEGCEDMVL